MLNMLRNPHFWKVWLPPHLFLVLYLVFVPNAAGVQFWITAFVFYTLISGLGVAVGLHRFFSHRAFKTSRFWEQAMLYFGLLACQGHALFWVALHRGLHHRFSDTDKDPHSPVTHSLWHSYQGYAFDPKLVEQVPLRAGGDFLRHPEWQWNVSHYTSILWLSWWAVLVLSAICNIPWLFGGLVLAQVWAVHQEAAVNVLGHVKGFGAYRNYDIDDHSVNRNLLGVITWGQALHNNHHGDPNSASFAQSDKFPKRFEFDPCVLWIAAIQRKEIK